MPDLTAGTLLERLRAAPRKTESSELAMGTIFALAEDQLEPLTVVGGMLRTAGAHDPGRLRAFLDDLALTVPRTRRNASTTGL